MKTFKNIMLGVLIAFVGLTFLVFLIPTDTAEPAEEVTVVRNEPKATPQRNQVLFESFLEGCNDNGKNEDFCTCSYDYFIETYGLDALVKQGIEVTEDSSYLSDEMLDTVLSCSHLYVE
jgi:hypothetical protein